MSTSRERWVDLRTAIALTGIRRLDLAWAMAEGAVRYDTKRLGHVGVPMLVLEDVQQLAAHVLVHAAQRSAEGQ
jgi:hypothetical protein